MSVRNAAIFLMGFALPLVLAYSVLHTVDTIANKRAVPACKNVGETYVANNSGEWIEFADIDGSGRPVTLYVQGSGDNK